MCRALNLILLFALFALAGCSTMQSGRGSRLLPWNWFAPDRAGQLEAQQDHTAEAKAKVMHQAHIEFSKIIIALEEAENSAAVLQARRFAQNGLALMAQADPLTAEETTKLTQLVRDLRSPDVSTAAAAERQQLKAEDKNNDLAQDLKKSQEREQELTTKLQESDRRYQAEAEKYRRLIFWVCLIAGGWIVLQLLAGAARFFPQLAPVAQIAGMVSAPVVQAAYNRTTAGIGRAISDAEKTGQATAELMRSFLDPHTDTAEQAAIRKHYLNEP